jgi:H2-forming N5,N10-methylenetetrahydromethanopterin dehydrogenase
MAPAFAALLVFVGFGVLVIVLFKLAAAQSRRARQNFTDLAQRLGLAPSRVQPKFGFWPQSQAEGLLRERPARLYGYTTGSGKHRTVWSALSVQPRAHGGLTFSLTPQGLGSKLAELFGAREITVGDPAFDKAWFIRTNQPEFSSAALLPELRARLTAAVQNRPNPRQPSLKLDGPEIVYVEAGAFNSDALRERFTPIADVAEVFAQSSRLPR